MPDRYQNKYRIPSARLRGYDYGQNGAYFITICTRNWIHYFGGILSSTVSEAQNPASLHASPIGMIAYEYWQKTPEHFAFIILDEFVVIPNHVHGILFIYRETHGAETQYIASLQKTGDVNKFGPQSGNISSVIRGYKIGVKSFATTNKIDFGWQLRFYDRIIRDGDEMKRIRKYIVENPDNWSMDRNNNETLYM